MLKVNVCYQTRNGGWQEVGFLSPGESLHCEDANVKLSASCKRETENSAVYELEFRSAYPTRIRLLAELERENPWHLIPCCIHGDNNLHHARPDQYPNLTSEYPDAAYSSSLWEFRADRASHPVSILATDHAAGGVSIDPYSRDLDGQLIRNGVLPSQAASVPETLPLLLTAYGAAAKNNPNRSETLTDYMQMQELLRLLKAKSVDNVLLRMSGALDGATSQGLLKSSDLSGKLGSEKELEALLQYAQTQQFSVYLNVDIASFGRRSARKSAHAAENIAGDTLSMAVNNPFTGVAGDAQHTRYLLRQTEIGENVDAFVNDFHSLAFSGYCIDDAGSTLYSDYASAGNTRTVAAGLMQEQAATLAAGRTLMVDTGNAYLLRDADIVVDLPSAADYPET